MILDCCEADLSGEERGTDAKCNGALVESSSALARIIKSFTAFIDYATNPSYRGATLAFNGRQLTSYTKGSNAITYKYDASGLRASKTVNGGTTTYQYVGDKLYFEQRADGSKLYYFYDSYGNLTHLYYHVGATKTAYNVVTNSQGDVIAIYNWNGNQLVASYSYDAWGNCTITQDTTGIGAINPIRYRGYYFDSEIGMYYLQSRYYDPNTGRFINADGYITTGQGVLSYNMYAYCMNNPVMYSDPSGYYSFEEFLEDAGKTIYKGVVVFDYYVVTPIKENVVEPVIDAFAGDTDNLKYDVSEKTGNVEIVNSYTTLNPLKMYKFLSENCGDEISGSKLGIMYEWYVHNFTYGVGVIAYYSGFDPDAEIINKSKNLNIGSTIYDDDHPGFSQVMWASYIYLFGVVAVYDIVAEITE